MAESMLYVTGAIDRLGKVSDGNTVCDYDAEEIARQITIATSIAPVSYDGCKINVLDCPGFFDFVGDALCALRAVEAGMIVTSAKDTGEHSRRCTALLELSRQLPCPSCSPSPSATKSTATTSRLLRH
ncbi:MAG: GTP-binding protein [Oscillospiraceae bacterium]